MLKQHKCAYAPSRAVCDCPAVAEIAEFARRAPRLDFSAAHARAVTDALKRAIDRSDSAIS